MIEILQWQRQQWRLPIEVLWPLTTRGRRKEPTRVLVSHSCDLPELGRWIVLPSPTKLCRNHPLFVGSSQGLYQRTRRMTFGGDYLLLLLWMSRIFPHSENLPGLLIPPTEIRMQLLLIEQPRRKE